MYLVQGFYKIKKINNFNVLKKSFKEKLITNSLTGTIIISPEGINGTIAGKPLFVTRCLKYIKKEISIKNFDSQNSSRCKFQPFNRAKVKIKNEPSMESMFPAKAPAIVRVKHTNGYEEKFIDAAFGDPTNPMSRKDLQEKFLVFSNTNMLHKKASSVIHMLSDLPNSLGDTPLKKFNILA